MRKNFVVCLAALLLLGGCTYADRGHIVQATPAAAVVAVEGIRSVGRAFSSGPAYGYTPTPRVYVGPPPVVYVEPRYVERHRRRREEPYARVGPNGEVIIRSDKPYFRPYRPSD